MPADPEFLLFGATGAVGGFARELLDPARTRCVSRAPAAGADESWLRLDLHRDAEPVHAGTLLSAGPLDAFAIWLARAGPRCDRIVALSSTSAQVKASSKDPEERALAARLNEAEAAVREHAARAGCGLAILRPTLIYGAARDATLTPIARRAQRLGFFALPRSATGLRQPVHARDVATAMVAAAVVRTEDVLALDLPGGETLRYDEMVARVLACVPGRPRLYRVPDVAFAAACRVAGVLGVPVPGAAVRDRMREDLVFDAGPAVAALRYAPCAFEPTATMFGFAPEASRAGPSQPSTR